jgi:putative restriction endonuclease
VDKMRDNDDNALIRVAAFEHARKPCGVQDHRTVTELRPSFVLDGERVPLINPQSG